MKKIVVSKNEAGQKLLKLLAKYLNTAPQSFLHKMLRKKNITLNGKKADGSELLKETDEVCLFLSDETIAGFQKENGAYTTSVEQKKVRETESVTAAGKKVCAEQNTEKQRIRFPKEFSDIRVIYEDDNVLLLNKPAGLLSQKATPEDVSVNEWVIDYMLKKGTLTQEAMQTFRPGVCNRLDRNTSGLITAGKSLIGLQTLSSLLKERTVHKDYVCIVRGAVKKAGSLKGYLEKDSKTNKVTVDKRGRSGKTMTKEADGQGKESYIETEYTPLMGNDRYTLLKVRLITGKTHQIRAHLASIGHPLIGDEKYGNREVNRDIRARFGLKYQLLHAAYLTFPKEMKECRALAGKVFFAPVPEVFEKITRSLFGKEYRWESGIQEDCAVPRSRN